MFELTQRLPDDALFEVLYQAQATFGHAETNKLFQATALVNKELLHESQVLLLRDIRLTNVQSALSLLKFLHQRPELHKHIHFISLNAPTYDFDKARDLWRGLAGVLPTCSRLTRLELGGIPNFMARCVVEGLLARSSALQHLELATPVPHDSSGYFMLWNWTYVAPLLPSLPRLTSLSLPGLTPPGEDQYIADDFFASPAESMQARKPISCGVKTLQLEDALLPKETLTDILATLPQLQYLGVVRPRQLPIDFSIAFALSNPAFVDE